MFETFFKFFDNLLCDRRVSRDGCINEDVILKLLVVILKLFIEFFGVSGLAWNANNQVIDELKWHDISSIKVILDTIIEFKLGIEVSFEVIFKISFIVSNNIIGFCEVHSVGGGCCEAGNGK